MSSAIPPAPPPVAPLPQLSPSAVLSVVADAGSGAALAKLQLGSILSAALTTASTAGDGKAVIQVMTADGTNLSLRLPPGLPIPDGAQLAMQFISQNGLPAFKLLSVNGRPLPGLSLGNAQLPLAANTPDLLASLGGGAGAKPQAGSAAIQPGAPAVVQASPGLVAGPPGLMATVIRSAPPGAVMMAPNPGAPGFDAEAKLPTSLANLPAGAQLSVRIAAVALPAQGGLGAGQAIPTSLAGPAASPGVAASAAPLAAAASAGLEPAPLANAASPQAGAVLPGRVGAPLAPPLPGGPPLAEPLVPGAPAGLAAPAPIIPTPAAPLPLAGLVVSHPTGANALVQTPAGLLSLPVAQPLPSGSVIQLEVIGAPLPPPPLLPPSQTPQGLGPAGWPALDAAADVLLQSDRQAAEQLMRMIPQAGPRLAAAMSMFAGAVRSGEFKQLAAEPVIKGLDKAGRRDLADRLKRDFLELTEEASRPVGKGDWQAITIPFAHGADIDPVRLYVHRPNEDEGGAGGRKGDEQRFILEVRMSRLGRMQFDGLVQKEAKRFDLIVRTDQPLGPDMCRDIAGIFAECAQMTGIKGLVSFQSGRSFVELPPTPPAATRIVV